MPLPLPAPAEARALLHHLLEHGDLVGKHSAGRTVIKLAVDDWLLEKLMAFDAEIAEFEDGGDTEPDVDAEEDGPPGVVELARQRVVRRRRAVAPSFGQVGSAMARRATIQLKVHGKVVQSVPLDREDIDCLINGLRQVTPCTPRIDGLVDLLVQIRDRGQEATRPPE